MHIERKGLGQILRVSCGSLVDKVERQLTGPKLELVRWVGELQLVERLEVQQLIEQLVPNFILFYVYLWVVDYLSFDWVVLNSVLEPFNWDVLSVLVLVDLGDVLSLIFDGVVIGVTAFTGDVLNVLLFFVFNVGSLIWHVFDS